MKKFVVSYQREGETYGENVLAQNFHSAEQIAKDTFGETAKVDGVLVMGFECNEGNVSGILKVVQNHCAITNTIKNV